MYIFDMEKSIAEAGQQARIFANGYYFRGRVNSNCIGNLESEQHHNKLAHEFAQWFAERVANHFYYGNTSPLDIPTAFLRWADDG